MRSIPIGTTGEFSLIVEQRHLASQFKDSLLPPVLATPILIMVLENASLNAIRNYLDQTESAVGTQIELEHVSPTPVGHRVIGRAEVISVDGRNIHFRISARDEREEIGRGHHSRAVTNLLRFAKRLNLKELR